ncbi:MAG: polysaccharide deacetylase family protein, partial [Alteromonadales bacterium]|nr:polysaccharide deacetylase family protein [Alteromonadales bacterium]
MMKKLIFSLSAAAALTQAAYADTYIRHNLAGYFPERAKVAVVMSDSSLQGKTWSLSNAAGVVASGTFGEEAIGKTKFTALNYNYEVDFSRVKTLGDYTLTVPGAIDAPIAIEDNPYGQIANEMLRLLKVRRSGTADTLDHEISHLGDAQAPYYRIKGNVEDGKWEIDPTGKKADMLGGWYDAGDYIKFTLTIAQTANVLLEAYEANPDIFVKTHSKSEYVDILDEIKFGLDYLMKTMPENDEFIIQLSTGLDHVGLEHWRLPENDLRDGEREALSALSPTHMAVTAAALAHGAKVFQTFDSALAANYKAKAIAIFDRSLQSDVLSMNAFERDATNDFYRDEDINNERALAAARLFELTNDSAYKTQAINFANTHGDFVYDNKERYSGLDYYYSETNSILMAYKVLGKTDDTSKHMGKIELDTHLSYANQPGNIWSTAQIPDWGNLANMMYIAGTAAEDLVNYGDDYYSDLAYNNLDYLLGRNPWGMSFVVSPGLSKIPTEYHSQIYYLQPEKTAIGMMINGPSKPKYVIGNPDIIIAPDAWEKKFNTSDIIDGKDEGINFFSTWTNYTGTEPTIFGQATGIYAIAALARLEKEGKAAHPVDGTVPAKKSPPGNLEVDKVPLFVTIGSDDNENPAGINWLKQTVNSLTNPNGLVKNNPSTLDGQKAKLTFLNTGLNVTKAGTQWKAAHDEGNETGNHTQTHNPTLGSGLSMSYSAWLNEIDVSNNAIVGIGIPRDEIVGFRAPRLEYNDNLFNVLSDEKFLYDSSIEDGLATGLDGTNYHWPYTLHAGSPGAIYKTTWDKAGSTAFEIGNYPEVFELPVYPWVVPADKDDGLPYDLRAKIKSKMDYFDIENGKITAFDYNLTALAKLNDANDIYAILKHTLDLRLQGNRAPLVIGVHSKNYSNANGPMAVALKRFLEYAITKQEVRIATHKQVIDWVQDPHGFDDAPFVVESSVTPHSTKGCDLADWDASTLYKKGDKVKYHDKEWTAGWETRNSVPGASRWGPWGEAGKSCTDTIIKYYGTISPAGDIPVAENASKTFTFTAEEGYKLTQVKVDGAVLVPIPVNSYTFNSVNTDHSIEATFGTGDPDPTYTVTPTSGVNGAIAPNTDVTVQSGASQLFTFTPDDGYQVKTVTVNDSVITDIVNNQHNVTNITADTRIDVTFEEEPTTTYTVTPTSGVNGVIAPNTEVTVQSGASQLFTFTPDDGYQVNTVTVNGTVIT